MNNDDGAWKTVCGRHVFIVDNRLYFGGSAKEKERAIKAFQKLPTYLFLADNITW